MPPKLPNDDSNKEPDKGELPQNRSDRVLRSGNTRSNTAQGSLPVVSGEPPAMGTGTRSGGHNSDFASSREKVNVALERQRQLLIASLRRAEVAAEIPDFERHLRDQARAKESDAENREEIIAAANKAVGGIEKFDAGVRMEAFEQRREATSLYEDFLFYQIPEYRLQYLEHLDGSKKKKANLIREGLPPGLLSQQIEYDKKLRPIITSFERNGVGMTEEIDYDNMGPNHLHVRLPRARRVPIGIGRPRNPPLLSPFRLDLNIEAIEKRRREVEDVKRDDASLNESHSERRIREAKLPSKLPTAKDLSRSRLKSGLHIAAGETSYDWKDSYDQRGDVVPGRILKMPAKAASDPAKEELYEFSKSPTTPIQYDARVGHNHITVTPGAKATDGRKEREKGEVVNKIIDEKPESSDEESSDEESSDEDSSDEDSSDDEGDLFAISYRRCSGLGDCPCGGEDQSDGRHENGGGPGSDGSHSGGEEENSSPVVPLSVAGGPEATEFFLKD